MVRCRSVRRAGHIARAARRQGAAADRCLRASSARPCSAQIVRELPETQGHGPAARRRRSSGCANQVLTSAPVRGPRRQRASHAVSGDLGDDDLERPRRHRRRHPLRRLASPSSRRWTRRSSSTARARRACSKPLRKRRQRPLLHPRLAPPTPRASAPASCSRSRRGTAPTEPWLDLNAELDAASAWRRDIEAESRLPRAPAPLRQGGQARRSARPAARPPARAPRSCATSGSATSSSSAAASAPARSAGATPTRLSKAIGERTLIAANPRQLTIVRPAIVESALHTPYPGWMESLKVADPILLGYGAGHHPRPLRRQPLDPDGPDPGRLRRQRLPRGRRDPAGGRHRAHDERVHGHAQPVHDRTTWP